MKQGKIWGSTMEILKNPALQFHRIDFRSNFKCSKHLHEHRWNGFFVERGQMIIRVWQKDYDLVDETILNPGDWTAVPPGVFHQFEGVSAGVAFELYWAEPLDGSDIVRETVGKRTHENIPD
tara:strand:+ start:1732 stop:2097 length:366 start_codon:yes stop_codon:yes gene_type:complete